MYHLIGAVCITIVLVTCFCCMEQLATAAGLRLYTGELLYDKNFCWTSCCLENEDVDPQYPFLLNATEAPLQSVACYDYIVVSGGPPVPDNGGTFEHLIGTKIGGSPFDDTSRGHTAADLLQYENPDRITVLLWANTQRVLSNKSNAVSDP
ncbi:unnamed protein product [Sphagnum tenellum]